MTRELRFSILGLVILPSLLIPRLSAADAGTLASEILKETGVAGGLVVHVHSDDEGDAALTEALRVSDAFLVQAIDANADRAAKARASLAGRADYGPLSVTTWDGKRLPYTDNLVNLLVSQKPLAISGEEVLRALAPRGVAYIKEASGWKKTVKPVPSEIDDWTHYFYDAKGNPVSKDKRIDYLRSLQWTGSPRWSRHHDHMSSFSACVSAAGRMFYIMDEGSPLSIFLPSHWKLIARDAFNGVILWKRDIPEWHTRFWQLKSGPATLPRRVVAIGDRVWTTLGIDAPVSLLDAATGKTIKEFAGTEGTEEIIVAGDALFAVVNPAPTKEVLKPRDDYDYELKEGARKIVAADAATGAIRWTSQHAWVCPLTLQADEARVYLHDGEKVVALDRKAGKPAWASKPAPRWKPMFSMFGPTLTIVGDTLIFAGGENFIQHKGGEDTMTAYATKTGQVLWTAPHPPSGYQSPEDLFVIDGTVWVGDVTTGGENPGKFSGYDLKTGKLKSEFETNVDSHWFHHRCYQARATERFILTSRTGIEFIDPIKKDWEIHHWVRGACLYGIMPANGMVYAPPHPCSCYLVAKMYGLSALAPASPTRAVPRDVPDAGRLEKGSAFGKIETSKAAPPESDEWPTYRGDIRRSGHIAAPVGANVKEAWRAQIGGKLSSPVIAGGKVIVSQVDRHAVVALDAESGKAAWTFVADGRVDSVPTISGGCVVFGSTDGHVYCLRASDGALAWRFRAAPEDRRHTYFEQVESVWPVPGSVLVIGGVVHCAAGRSIYLDGGLRLLRLDLATGAKLGETVWDDRDPASGDNVQVTLKQLNMPTALNDILSSDGKFLYMRIQQADMTGKRTEVIAPTDDSVKLTSAEGQHLFSPTGFLDDSWWHRTYWVFGKGWISGAGGYMRAGQYQPSGNILAFDDERVFGFGRRSEFYKWTDVLEYRLFASSHQPSVEELWKPRAAKDDGGDGKAGKKGKKKAAAKPPQLRAKIQDTWEQPVPMLVRAMALAGDQLFIAGPADVLDEEASHTKLMDPAVQVAISRQEALLLGKEGAILRVVSTTDGKTIKEHKLGALPIFDGMAAAYGSLFLSCNDGTLIRLRGGAN